jgi:hypothetical protein
VPRDQWSSRALDAHVIRWPRRKFKAPNQQETGLTGSAERTRISSPIMYYAMAAAEHREPCESRDSRTVLGPPGGVFPPRDSPKAVDITTRLRPNDCDHSTRHSGLAPWRMALGGQRASAGHWRSGTWPRPRLARSCCRSRTAPRRAHPPAYDPGSLKKLVALRMMFTCLINAPSSPEALT